MSRRLISDALIDAVYGALLGEADWHEFLDMLRTILPNGQSVLFYHDTSIQAGALALNSGLDDSFAQAYADHYSRINPWMAGATTRPIGKGVSAKAMLPHEELLRTEYYNDFLRPQGVDSAVGITLAREGGCNFLLSVTHRDVDDREAIKGAKTLEAIAPHLKRAFGFYRRNHGAGAALTAASSVVEALRIGVIALGYRGAVKSANAAATRLLDAAEGIWVDHCGRLQCTSTEAMSRLGAELSLWSSAPQTSYMDTWLLPRPGGKLPLRLTMFRPGRSAMDVYFAGPEVVLLLEDAEAGRPSIKLLGQHFGLTPAEQRLVAGIADGRTVDEIAADFAISVGTARTQLKRAFEKMGVQRQAEMVRLVHLLGRGAVPEE